MDRAAYCVLVDDDEDLDRRLRWNKERQLLLEDGYSIEECREMFGTYKWAEAVADATFRKERKAQNDIIDVLIDIARTRIDE